MSCRSHRAFCHSPSLTKAVMTLLYRLTLLTLLSPASTHTTSWLRGHMVCVSPKVAKNTQKREKKNSSGKIRKDPLTRKYRGKVPTQMDDFKQKSRRCQSQRQATSLPPSLSSARSSVHNASCHLPSAVSITLTCVCCTRQRQRNVCKHRWIVKGNYVNRCKRVNIPPACLSSRSTFQPRSCWATEKEPITDAYVM